MNVIFEDQHLLVVDKPSGLLVHPTGAAPTGNLLEEAASYLGFTPGLAHRLDRETSGLVILTKSARALRAITLDFSRRRVRKRYAALVHGIPPDGAIVAPIGRDPLQRPQWRVLADGRPAESRLTVLEPGERSLVSLVPITGRTNQLRIHCAHLGHPIVGDDRYGSPVVARLCLHAAAVTFEHPVGRRTIELETPIPADILALRSPGAGG